MPFLRKILKSFSSFTCLRKRTPSQWLSSFTNSFTSMCMSLTRPIWSSTSRKLAQIACNVRVRMVSSSEAELGSPKSSTRIGSPSQSSTRLRSRETLDAVSNSTVMPTKRLLPSLELHLINSTSMVQPQLMTERAVARSDMRTYLENRQQR